MSTGKSENEKHSFNCRVENEDHEMYLWKVNKVAKKTVVDERNYVNSFESI